MSRNDKIKALEDAVDALTKGGVKSMDINDLVWRRIKRYRLNKQTETG